MIEVLAHFAGGLASLLTVGWRLATETKKFDREWWWFVLGHGTNVTIQVVAGLVRLSQ